MTPIADEVARKAARDELWTRAFQIYTVTLLTLALGALLWMSVSYGKRGIENHQILTTVTGCTTPGEDCHDRAEKEQAKAVVGIIGNSRRASAAAAACAAKMTHPTYKKVLRCTNQVLNP